MQKTEQMTSLPPTASRKPLTIRFVLALITAGTAVFVWKLSIVAHIRFIGAGDPAGYAEMAQSILNNRGFEVNYISMHFIQFAQDIAHPEDTWPPLYALLIVPFFAFMGATAFAAKLPSLVISCFALPLVTFFLGRRVSGSNIVAAASALTVLLYLPFFCWSLQGFADITFAFFIVVSILCMLKGFERARSFLMMGILLALAYYAKVSALIVVGAFCVYYLLRTIFDSKRKLRSRQTLFFVLGILLFGLLVAPWWIRNEVHFDDPMYSNHKHVVGTIGWKSWEEGTYGLYWNTDPPSIHDKLNDPAKLFRSSLAYLGQYLRYLFVDLPHDQLLSKGYDTKPITLGEGSTLWIGIPAALGILLYLATMVRKRFLINKRGKTEDRSAASHSAFIKRGYGLFLLTIAAVIFPLAILWFPLARLTAPVVPLVIIMAWATVHGLLIRAFRSDEMQRIATACLIVLVVLWSVMEYRGIRSAGQNGRFPWHEDGHSLMAVGDWLHENAPGSITMTKHPWELRFYSKGKTVRLPKASLNEIIDVARYYKVTHIVPDGNDRTLYPWVQGRVPGLKKVCSTPGLELFEIDFSQLDE